MIHIRKSQARGHANHGWLDSYHTFSFADYYDPQFMGFSELRVINEDFIAGGGGFPPHPHKDMEIVSYVVEGALEHKDSMGNSTRIVPGELQRMSAGTGIRHSEFNHYQDRQTHLLQIWILPNQEGIVPSYEQKSFADRLSRGEFVLAASSDGEAGSIRLSQDVKIYVLKTDHAGEKQLSLSPGRRAWLQVVRGNISVNQNSLEKGDGAAIVKEEVLQISWQPGAEFLVFDLP